MVQLRPNLVHHRCSEVAGLSKSLLDELYQRWIKFGRGVHLTKEEFQHVYGSALFGDREGAKVDDIYEFFSGGTSSLSNAGISGYVDNLQVLGALVVGSSLSRGEKFQFIRDHLLLSKKSRAVDLASIMEGTALLYDKSLNQVKTEQEISRLQDKTDKDLLDWLCEYDGTDSGMHIRIADTRNLSYRQAILTLTVHERFLDKDSADFSKEIHVPSSCKLVNVEMGLEKDEKAPISFVEVDLVQIQSAAKDPTCIEQWIAFPNDRGDVLLQIKPTDEELPEALKKKLREAKCRILLEAKNNGGDTTQFQLPQKGPEWILGYNTRITAKFLDNDQVVYASSRYTVLQSNNEQRFTPPRSSPVQGISVNSSGKMVAIIEKDSNMVSVFESDLQKPAFQFRASGIEKPALIEFSDMHHGKLVVVDKTSRILAIYSWKESGKLLFSEDLDFVPNCIAYTNDTVLVFGRKAVAIEHPSQNGPRAQAKHRAVRRIILFTREDPDTHTCCATLKLNSVIAVSGTESGNLYAWTSKETARVTKFAHTGPILAVTVISGRTIVTGGCLGSIKLWDASSFTVLAAMRPFQDTAIILGLSASPTGATVLVTTLSGPLASFDVDSKCLRPKTIFQPVSNVVSIETSPNKLTAVFASSGSFVALWSLDSHQILKRVKMPGTITTISWCVTTSTVAVGLTDGTIAFLDSNTLSQKDSTTSTANEILAYSSNGKLLACAKNRQVQVFNGCRLVKSIRLKKRLRTNSKQRKSGTMLAFQDSNRELRYCNIVWETRTWKALPKTEDTEDMHACEQMELDHLCVLDRCAILAQSGIKLTRNSGASINSSHGYERNLLYPVDGRQWFPSEPNWVFGMSTLEGKHHVQYCYTGQHSVIFPAACYLVVSPLDGGSKKQTCVHMPHHKAVIALAVDHADGSIIAAGLVDEVIIYDLSPTKNQRLQRIPYENVSCITFSQVNQENLIVANASSVSVYCWKTGSELLSRKIGSDSCVWPLSLYSFDCHSECLVYLQYKSNDLTIWNATTDYVFESDVEVSASADFGVVADVHGSIFEITKQDEQLSVERRVSRAHTSEILCLWADKQGVISAASDNSIKLWTGTFEALRDISLPDHGLVDCLFRRDNHILMARNCGEISVLPSSSNGLSSTRSLHFGIAGLKINDCCLLDKSTLCIVSDDKMVHILDASDVMNRELSDYATPLVCTGFQNVVAVGMDDFTFYILDRALEILARTKADNVAVLKAGCLYFSCRKASGEHVRLNVRGWDGYFEVSNFQKDTFTPGFLSSSRRSKANKLIEYKLEQRVKASRHGIKEDESVEEILREENYKFELFQGGLAVFERLDQNLTSKLKGQNVVQSFVSPALAARELQVGSEAVRLDWIFGAGHSAALNAYGNLLYCVDSTAVVDKPSQQRQCHFKHSGTITSMSVDQSGELVATTCQGMLHIWDANTCAPVYSVRGPFQFASFAPKASARLGVLCQGGRLVVLESFNNPAVWHNCASVVLAHDGCPDTLQLHWADEDTIVCGNSIYSVSRDVSIVLPNLKITCASSACFDRTTASFAVGTVSGSIHYLDQTGKFLKSVDGHKPESCTCMASYEDGKSFFLVSGGMDSRILIWSGAIGSKAKDIPVHAPVSAISPSFFGIETGLVVTTITQDIIKVRISAGYKVETLSFGLQCCIRIAANPVFPNYVASVDSDSTLRLWDLYSRKLVYIRRGPDTTLAQVRALGWYGSGELLFLITEGGVTLFTFDTLRPELELSVGSNLDNGVKIITAGIGTNAFVMLLSNSTIVVYNIDAANPMDLEQSAVFEIDGQKPYVNKDTRVDVGFSSLLDCAVIQVSNPKCVTAWYECATGDELDEVSAKDTIWSSQSCLYGWRMCGIRQKNVERVVTSANLERVAVLSGSSTLLHAYSFPVDPEKRCICAIGSSTSIVDMDFTSDNKHIVHATASALYITALD